MGDQLYPAQLLEDPTQPDTVRPVDAVPPSHAAMPGDEVTSVVRNGNRRGNEGGIKAACQMTAFFVGDTL